MQQSSHVVEQRTYTQQQQHAPAQAPVMTNHVAPQNQHGVNHVAQNQHGGGHMMNNYVGGSGQQQVQYTEVTTQRQFVPQQQQNQVGVLLMIK